MRTRELAYEDESRTVRLIIGEATALAGMKRALLTGRAQSYLDSLTGAMPNAEAEEEVEENVEDGVAFDSIAIAACTLLVRYLYPDLLAAVVEAEGLDVDMDVEAFLSLPQALTDAWQNLVYELCPAWYPFHRKDKKDADDDADAEKKARTAAASAAG